MKDFRIFAPATIGNIGSGFDVLGMAVEGIGDRFHFQASDHYSIAVIGRDAGSLPLDPALNAVTLAAEAYYRNANVSSIKFHVTIERQLPLAGGLGSSAASSVAGAMAAGRFLGATDNLNSVLAAALHAETLVAGPHLDNIAPCVCGGVTLIKDVPSLNIYRIPVQAKVWLTLLTPPLKIRTKDARDILPKSLDTVRWTRQMAHCSSLALALALGDYDQIAFGLKDPFAEPHRGQLIPGFFKAQALAMASGALGFTLSGSGPTCFAVSLSEEAAVHIGELVRDILGAETTVFVSVPSVQGAYFI